MIKKSKFEIIKDLYGHWASWAVWAEEGDTPKSNIGNLDIFENDQILDIIDPNIILVALNWSRGPIQKPFANFHDPRPMATDFKIRYALKNTPLWGGYMTDILKEFDQKSSGKVIEFLKMNKHFEEKNIALFRKELLTLEIEQPKIVAFGSVTYSILKRNFSIEFQIFKVPHYANYGSKENYRTQVAVTINNMFSA
jgi:hypothetical protein